MTIAEELRPRYCSHRQEAPDAPGTIVPTAGLCYNGLEQQKGIAEGNPFAHPLTCPGDRQAYGSTRPFSRQGAASFPDEGKGERLFAFLSLTLGVHIKLVDEQRTTRANGTLETINRHPPSAGRLRAS
jgi:hypothetical protein